MIWQREMAMELKEAQPAGRKAILARYQAEHGGSDAQMYRIAKIHGFNSGRKQRADKGIGILTEEQLEFIAATLYKCGRENKGAFMPIENAMEFAIDNGIMLRGEVSLATVQRQLREREMNKKQLNAPTPHTDMRSLHPNHVHLVDVSTCIQYYLDDGGMKIMRQDEFYKNKFENFKKVKTPLQRYVLSDHFSGFMFVHYYLAAGETAENLFDFICRAWEAKAEQNFPFRGVPFAMLVDGGTRAKAKAMGSGFWDGLGIEILSGTPGNSRRQGSVEVSHKIWEEWFETRLRIDPATNIDDLNRKARGFCIWMNATREHTRTRMTRLSCWLMIKQDQLRELPERSLLQDLMNKPEETRTVTNHRISFDGKEFNLKHINIAHGTKVKVIKNIWKWKDGIITVSYDNQLFEAKAIEKLSAELGGFNATAAIIGQEYKAQPETATQKAKKRLDELATGSRSPGKDALPFAGMNAFEGFEEKVANVVMGARSVSISFSAELKGSGVAYSASIKPALGVYFRGCGMLETMVTTAGSESATYTPASTGVPSLTIWVYEDGLIKKARGCRGTWKITGKTGEVCTVGFTFTGVFDSVVDGAMISPTFESTVPPVLLGSALSLDAVTTLVAESFSLDMANQTQLRSSFGTADGYMSAMITGRKPSGTLDPEMTLVATYDFIGKWKSGNQAALSIGPVLPGTGLYNKFTITAPKCVYTKVGESDRNGIMVADLAYNLLMNTGDDEISIAFVK